MTTQVLTPDGSVSFGSVLVVEDEALVRMVAVDLLEMLGLSALEAGSAREAVDMMRTAEPRICAALVDIGLPDRRGDVLAGELHAMDSELRIIIASGYGEDALDGPFREDSRIAFLSKPYGLEQLRDRLQTLGVASA